MVLAGRPRDHSYAEDLADLERAMEDARSKLGFKAGTQGHRRGEYPHISTGISYGGGSKVRTERAMSRPFVFAHFSPPCRLRETSE